MRANETTVTELDAGVSWVLVQHTAPRGALSPRLHVGWVAFHLCRPRLVFLFSFWSPPKEYQNSRKALALAQGLSLIDLKLSTNPNSKFWISPRHCSDSRERPAPE